MRCHTPEALIAELDRFNPARDEVENLCRLYEIFDGFRALGGREVAMHSMFALLERFPEAEFGSPGPIVQEIEHMGAYEESLKASLARIPTRYTVLMVNRILNVTSQETTWLDWMNVLQSVQSHPLADDDLRRYASEFAAYQTERTQE
jgi:hypothetical protein